MRQATIWLSAIAAAVLGPAANARAADVVVGAGQSVQAAVDAAPAGATITVAAGTFGESVTIAKALTLQGAGWEKTTIGPDRTMPPTQKQKDAFFAALEATDDPRERAKLALAIANRRTPPALIVKDAKGVVLRGLRFRGPPIGGAEGGLSNEALVTFDHAGGSITGCAVVGPSMNGIAILAGSAVKIEKSLVAALWNTGVSVADGAELIMTDCDVRNCYHRCVTIGTDEATVERCRIGGSAWHGVRYDDCSPKILSSHIFGNARSGIYASGQTSATVRGNVFWRNEMNAMSCWFDNADTVEGNTILENLREGIAVLGASKTNLAGNVFVANPIGVLCGKVATRGQPAGEPPSGDPKLTGNFFFNNPRGMQDGVAEKPLPPGNLSADPKVGTAADNFRLAADSPARGANAGAADPIAFASPFPIQPEEASMIPDSETRDSSKWKKVAIAR